MNLTLTLPQSVQGNSGTGRLRAPVEDGGILSQPTLHLGRQLALENAQLLDSSVLTIAGRSIGEMRTWTRAACLTAGLNWMSRILGTSPRLPEGIFFVTGHQPSLNHPGVWAKNIAVSHLARCSGTTGIHLIVDNDLAGPPSIRVPAGSREEPHFENLFYDAVSSHRPWEERHLADPELFDSFADRVASALKPWNIRPAILDTWPAAIEARARTTQIPALLTACRVADERNWGVANLELPVSELCRTEPFLAFTQHLVQHVECFFTAYNSAVHWYRRKYHVRNDRHPVPDLEQIGSRLELPFWYWAPGETDRRRVFVERTGQLMLLFAGEEQIAVLPSEGFDVSALAELQERGRLRTRALTTTLFSRLCLADLFLHGIGGARYDEITDRLIQNFLGLTPPSFMTVTATVRLPLDPYPVTQDNLSRLKQELRQRQFQGPAIESEEVRELRERRASLIEESRNQRTLGLSQSDRRARQPRARQRHREIREIEDRLKDLAQADISSTEQALHRAKAELTANQVLKSREFATALFPSDALKKMVDTLRGEICTGRQPMAGR